MKRQIKIIPLVLVGASFLVFPLAYGQNKFKLKPDAKGKLCLSCHDNFKEKLKNHLFIPLLKQENVRNAITLIQLLMESCWMKIRTKSVISAMKGLFPKIQKASIKS